MYGFLNYKGTDEAKYSPSYWVPILHNHTYPLLKVKPCIQPTWFSITLTNNTFNTWCILVNSQNGFVQQANQCNLDQTILSFKKTIIYSLDSSIHVQVLEQKVFWQL